MDRFDYHISFVLFCFFQARKVHVKKCGQKLGVTTDQVLKLMKKQEEEHQMLIAAGVLPKSALK